MLTLNIYLDDPVILLLLEHLLSNFTSLFHAVAAETLFTINFYFVVSCCCCWNIIYYKLVPRLILLLLEHYLLSTFASYPAAVGTLFTINFYLV